MNGDVFRGLHNLKEVLLSSNECVKEDFKTEAAIAKLPEVLSQNCGFCEKIHDLTNCELRWDLKEIEANLMEKLKSEVEPLLTACTSNLKFHQILETQMKEIRSANLKVHQELKLIQSKIDENEKLRDELRVLQLEDNEKKAELKLALFEEISN
jgi:hypothetical protein